ncbi:MAG: LURP-one-related family protein [Clostridia bacterium]|nr:LURP-one-related family protein [Clostridia bacterium]
MGITSKFNRFREAGQEANVNNVAQFGQPLKSLFTSSKVFTLHHRIEITDEAGNVVYLASTKFPSLHDRTTLTDAAGNPVAQIWKKFFTIHERHFITMADGTAFQLSNELFHLIKDISNIEGLGWQLRGNILGLNFQLYDGAGNILAVISQKMISLHDKYCVDLYRADAEQPVVAILITLQHMIKDREVAASSSSSSSSSSSN